MQGLRNRQRGDADLSPRTARMFSEVDRGVPPRHPRPVIIMEDARPAVAADSGIAERPASHVVYVFESLSAEPPEPIPQITLVDERSDGGDRYTAYRIECGDDVIWRRFSEFAALHQKVRAKHWALALFLYLFNCDPCMPPDYTRMLTRVAASPRSCRSSSRGRCRVPSQSVLQLWRPLCGDAPRAARVVLAGRNGH